MFPTESEGSGPKGTLWWACSMIFLLTFAVLQNGSVHHSRLFVDCMSCIWFGRVKVDLNKLSWKVLPLALQMGAEADEACQKAKQEGLLPNRALKKRKRRDQRLKFTDPW